MNVKEFKPTIHLIKILSLNFNLGPSKMNTHCVKKINFAKDYQKDSYNKTNLMGKQIKKIKAY
jgi:hypothetical protein